MSTHKSTQRPAHAFKPKSGIRQRKNVKRTGEAPRDDGGPFIKIDIPPEDFFKAWSRKKREALIEMLIDSLDAESTDPDLEDGADDEFSLAGYNHCSSLHDDAEVDDSDDEPSLGWTDQESTIGSYVGVNGCYDLEEDAGDMPESDPAEYGFADRDGVLEQIGHDPRFGTFHPGAAAI